MRGLREWSGLTPFIDITQFDAGIIFKSNDNNEADRQNIAMISQEESSHERTSTNDKKKKEIRIIIRISLESTTVSKIGIASKARTMSSWWHQSKKKERKLINIYVSIKLKQCSLLTIKRSVLWATIIHYTWREHVRKFPLYLDTLIFIYHSKFPWSSAIKRCKKMEYRKFMWTFVVRAKSRRRKIRTNWRIKWIARKEKEKERKRTEDRTWKVDSKIRVY